MTGRKRMIKGILFDFDGTLSYRVESAYFMYRYLLHSMFPEMDVHSIEFEARVQRCMLWDEFGTINKRHALTMIKEKWKPDLYVEKYVEIWYRLFPQYQVAMPDAYAVLDRLKEKYVLGLVSNGHLDTQEPKIDILDLHPYFKTEIISKDFGVDKPDVRIYNEAAKRLGLKCEEIAFIGDTFDTDILGASKAGMMPVWYCYEHRCVTLYDVCMVSSFKEIGDLFLDHAEWNH